MGLLDVLSQYRQRPDQPPPHVLDDFDRVSSAVSPDDLAPGLEDAFNAEETPPFEQMVRQLYDRSDDDTRAGLLKEIFGRGAVSPREARNVPASEIERAAAEARRQDPSIVQNISRFYARHPQLVQVLGQAALSILMSGMARRRRI